MRLRSTLFYGRSQRVQIVEGSAGGRPPCYIAGGVTHGGQKYRPNVSLVEGGDKGGFPRGATIYQTINRFNFHSSFICQSHAATSTHLDSVDESICRGIEQLHHSVSAPGGGAREQREDKLHVVGRCAL